MSHYEWVNQNINTVLQKVCENDNLCKLLYYDNDNPLASDNLADNTILYKNVTSRRIFTGDYSPDVNDKRKTILNIIFDDFTLGNQNIYMRPNIIKFCIICHQKTWPIIDGSEDVKLRPIMIMHEIDSIMNRQRVVGLGKNYSKRSNYFHIEGSNYSGYLSTYTACDFA